MQSEAATGIYGIEIILNKYDSSSPSNALCRFSITASILRTNTLELISHASFISLGIEPNYLFCGNHEAAENMCVVISLLSSCRNHNINPRDYLNDIIARMPNMTEATNEEFVELLPHKWKRQTEVATATTKE